MSSIGLAIVLAFVMLGGVAFFLRRGRDDGDGRELEAVRRRLRERARRGSSR